MLLQRCIFPPKTVSCSSLKDLMGLFTACYCLCSWRWLQHWCPTIAALVSHFSSKVTSWMAVATHILCQLISFFAWLVYINSQRFQRPLQCMYMYIYSSFQANWSALVEESNNTSVRADWVVSMIFLNLGRFNDFFNLGRFNDFFNSQNNFNLKTAIVEKVQSNGIGGMVAWTY